MIELFSVRSRLETGSGNFRSISLIWRDIRTNNSISIDYLKIDTEGYDFKVLLGAKSLFEENRVRFVQFEYNSNWNDVGHSLKQADTYMNGLGYQLFLIRSTGLHPINYEYWGDYYRYSNYFARRPSDINALREIIKSKI